MYFHDFQINFAQLIQPPAAPSGIDLLAGQDGIVERVVFSDCPQGVTFSNFLEGTVRNCVFIWNTQLTGIGVNVTGPAAAMGRCNEILIEKSNFRVGASDLPNDYIAIQITQCEHTAIKTLQIAGTNQGILIAPNAQTGLDVQFTTIEDVESGTPAAGLAVIPPSPTGSTVGGLIVVGGWFYQTPKQTSYTSGGLYFDTGGGASTQLDGVKLHGVTVFNWAGYCAQFKDGQNFEIIGGTYSGTQAVGGGLGCHAITGPVKKLTCIGADLSAMYTGEPDVVSNPQPFALVIPQGANPDQIRYDRCRMLGYTGSPVSISGSPTNLFITNCPGYNDQNTPVSASAPTSLTSAAQLGYYGPSEVNFSGGTAGGGNPTSYTINTKTGSKTFTVTAASIYLSSPYDEIEISNLPTNSPFTWIGK